MIHTFGRNNLILKIVRVAKLRLCVKNNDIKKNTLKSLEISHILITKLQFVL